MLDYFLYQNKVEINFIFRENREGSPMKIMMNAKNVKTQNGNQKECITAQ